MKRATLVTSGINVKIVVGFFIVAVLLLAMGGIAYRNLVVVRSSFELLDNSVSKQIISLEEVRGNYSLMLLEMTTFLLLDFEEKATDELNRLNGLKNVFVSSLTLLEEYFSERDDLERSAALQKSGEDSVVLVDRIISLRGEGKSLEEILPFKKQLKQIEKEQFFPLVSEILDSNKSRIEVERARVKAASQNATAFLLVFGVLAFGISIAIGFVVSSREKLVDQFRDQLISITSHQLKSPITVIKGNLALLGESDNFSSEERNSLKDLEESADNLIETVENLLDLSRIDEGRFKLESKKISLVDLMDHIVSDFKSLAEKNDVKINIEKPQKDYHIFADGFRITQAIKNIIDNAIKYSNKKGEVKISLKEERNKIVVSIKDSGIGIPAEDQKKIFGRFFRASNVSGKKSGSGLGLFIVKNIIERSGGKISFESKEENGTTFLIHLPKSIS